MKKIMFFFFNKMSKKSSIHSLNLQSKKKWIDYSKGIEKDTIKVEKRQNQIDNHCKNSPSYKFYIASVPKDERSCNDPITPRANQVCSVRNFNGQIRVWRHAIFLYNIHYNIWNSHKLGQYLLK